MYICIYVYTGCPKKPLCKVLLFCSWEFTFVNGYLENTDNTDTNNMLSLTLTVTLTLTLTLTIISHRIVTL